MHVDMWQDCKGKHCYESTVTVALEVACAMSAGTGGDYSRDGRPIQVSDFKVLPFLALSAAVHGGQGTSIPEAVL